MVSSTTRRLWLIILVVVPAAYNPWSRGHFEPDKSALLILLTSLLLGNACWRGDLPSLRWSRAEKWIAVFLVIRWLSMTRSTAPDWSLWGDPRWRNGWWVTLAGCLLFFLARRYFSVPGLRDRAISAILSGSALVAVYAIGDYFNPFDGKQVVRAGGTQGHAILLAAYLAMVLPLTVRCVFHRLHRKWLIALLGLQLVCLLLTFARAGWLAALCGLGGWGIVGLWWLGRQRMAILVTTLLIAGLVILFVFSLLPPLPGSAPHSLQTLTSMFRWKGATAQTRLLAWEASLSAIRDRPWLGHGPASFRIVFERYVPPDLAPFGGSPALGGRVHNVYLETALESGLIGLGAYMILLAVVFVHALTRDIPTHGALMFRAAILAALVANLVNNVFSFDSATTILLFWTLAGMAHAEHVPDGQTLSPAPRRRVLGGIAASMGIILAGWMVTPDVMVYRGERLAQQERWSEAVGWLEKAIDLAPTPDPVYDVLGTVYANWATEKRDLIIWQDGAEIYTELIVYRDQVAAYHEQRGLYLHRWYTFDSDPAMAAQSVTAYTIAIQLSPRDPDLWLDRGLMRLDAGDLSSALGDFDHANSLLNDYARYYGVMAIYALKTGDYEAAAVWNARAVEAERKWDDWAWRR